MKRDLMVHVMVDDIEKTIELARANGGELVRPVGDDLPEITAKVRDPGGNVIGLYQQRGSAS